MPLVDSPAPLVWAHRYWKTIFPVSTHTSCVTKPSSPPGWSRMVVWGSGFFAHSCAAFFLSALVASLLFFARLSVTLPEPAYQGFGVHRGPVALPWGSFVGSLRPSAAVRLAPRACGVVVVPATERDVLDPSAVLAASLGSWTGRREGELNIGARVVERGRDLHLAAGVLGSADATVNSGMSTAPFVSRRGLQCRSAQEMFISVLDGASSVVSARAYPGPRWCDAFERRELASDHGVVHHGTEASFLRVLRGARQLRLELV